MDKNKELEVIKKLETELSKLEKNEFKVFFFIIDSKGNPSGSLEYIYETAYQLHELGYNIQMLHNEKEFVGVSEWLGEKYASLPHANIEDDKINISPSDFLIIPEIFSNVMAQTKKLPCKRIALLQNFNYLTEFMPVGATWDDLGIYDVITTSSKLESMIKEVFPSIRSHIVRPSIKPIFRENVEPKKLIVNIVAKNQSDVNRIVKPFYWKAPIYKWVTFRDLRGLSKEEFANALRESPITVWVDTETFFGYSPLEAMKCGNIVIGKIPEVIPEWMENGDDLKDNGLWFSEMKNVHLLIANVIRAWIYDEIPDTIYKNMEEMKNAYSVEEQIQDIKKVYISELFHQRKNEINILLTQLKNKIEK